MSNDMESSNINELRRLLAKARQDKLSLSGQNTPALSQYDQSEGVASPLTVSRRELRSTQTVEEGFYNHSRHTSPKSANQGTRPRPISSPNYNSHKYSATAELAQLLGNTGTSSRRRADASISPRAEYRASRTHGSVQNGPRSNIAGHNMQSAKPSLCVRSSFGRPEYSPRGSPPKLENGPLSTHLSPSQDRIPRRRCSTDVNRSTSEILRTNFQGPISPAAKSLDSLYNRRVNESDCQSLGNDSNEDGPGDPCRNALQLHMNKREMRHRQNTLVQKQMEDLKDDLDERTRRWESLLSDMQNKINVLNEKLSLKAIEKSAEAETERMMTAARRDIEELSHQIDLSLQALEDRLNNRVESNLRTQCERSEAELASKSEVLKSIKNFFECDLPNLKKELEEGRNRRKIQSTKIQEIIDTQSGVWIQVLEECHSCTADLKLAFDEEITCLYEHMENKIKDIRTERKRITENIERFLMNTENKYEGCQPHEDGSKHQYSGNNGPPSRFDSMTTHMPKPPRLSLSP